MISVEKSEPSAVHVRELVEAHRSGKASVAITTVSASESLAGSAVFPGSARQFRARIERLKWEDLDQELGPCVIGLAYIGMSRIVDDNFKAEIDDLWSAICPTIQRKLPANVTEAELWSPTWKKWRNAWCDVHTLWTHIKSGRDFFVTSNTKDFQRNFAQLNSLGLKSVVEPKEAIAKFK